MFEEYRIIQEYYGGKRTVRSDIPLINHIDEGLIILNHLNASESAKRAYCIHPITQTDLKNNLDLVISLSPYVLLLAMEYRNVANRCLSYHDYRSIDIGELDDVKDMLIADKVQNRKDFELYHKLSHQRSVELDFYFKSWLKALGIEEDRYLELKNLID